LTAGHDPVQHLGMEGWQLGDRLARSKLPSWSDLGWHRRDWRFGARLGPETGSSRHSLSPMAVIWRAGARAEERMARGCLVGNRSRPHSQDCPAL